MKAIEGSEISILGFRDVKIDDVDVFLKNTKTGVYPATAQIVDATKVAGKLHLFFAFLNAQKSFTQKREVSGNLEMETLLYASCTKQIDKAIDMMGVKPQTSMIAVIIFASDNTEVTDSEMKLMKLVSGARDDRVLEVNGQGKIESLMTAFGVTKLELKTMICSETTVSEALTWLIVERVSLLAVYTKRRKTFNS